MPIQIRLTGNFHQMGEFVGAIAELPRIVTLHDVNIRNANSKDTSGNNLVMDVTAKTYRYLDESEQATNKKQGKKK